MGWGKNSVSNEYLDEERKKLWKEVISLREELGKKTSDHEKDAKQASKKASEFRNRSQEAKDTAYQLLNEIQQKNKDLSAKQQEVENLLSGILETNDAAKECKVSISAVNSKVETINSLFADREGLDEKIARLEEIAQSGEQQFSRVNAAYTGLIKRKNEIDELYYEIVGYEEKGEGEDEKVHVEGLKDELEKSYKKLQTDVESLKSDINTFQEQASTKYEQDNSKRDLSFQGLVDDWNKKHGDISLEIKRLLPDALTAGLSHAFSEKRKAEIKDGEKLSKVFNWSIVGLVMVSLIPFAVNIYLLEAGKTLESVILDMPRVVTAILPLYIPFLWLAYSSNKKSNLSKRLVEEYTHKEVLSKTFEGLSSQIENIADSDMSSELRVKLLYNILDVSSENPGKLISDYNTADHPLMDALDKSSKLSEAVESLSKIPGLSKVASLLEKRSEDILFKEAKKVEDAIESVANRDQESAEKKSA